MLEFFVVISINENFVLQGKNKTGLNVMMTQEMARFVVVKNF